MVVWSGRGFLVFLVLIVCAVAAIALLPELYQDLGIIASIFIAAIFSWIMGKKWNGQPREFIDKQSGQTVTAGGQHTLFWLKMEYWGIILGALGIVGLVRHFL